MNDIAIRNLYKSYGEKRVLDDLSCVFRGNAVTCVMGPSGCGKTTLMRLILGLEKPDAGQIDIPKGTVFSCVFQEDRLIRHLSAVKNCTLAVPQAGEAETRGLLARMGLEDSADKPVRELSGGMARRVAIARALLRRADVYIMDEPLKGLDDKTSQNVISLIQDITKRATLILITHDIDETKAFQGELLELKIN